jgi:asparagine synthase (glutamine-hydrolysing)
MCGICGIARHDKAPIESELLKRMNNALRHRGPDGEGYYFRPGIGLAMRRLAIIDVAGGDQPIANEDETLWLVYNGESFNFPELHKDLKRRGHIFRTLTDTECVLHLYEEYGDDCVNHLRGQFSFALWDDKKQRLLLARDRLGQKPMYYTVQDGVLYFGSELSSLFAALPQRPAIHLPALDMYLSLQYIPEPLTPYEGIYKLPAAHRMVWQNGELRSERYWDLAYGPKLTGSPDELAEALRQRVRQAVNIRLISEVPLGAHLSGGIDSSIVVAMMAEASQGPVKTFSVGFEETSFSELPYARRVAERYATDHYEFTLRFGDIPATIEMMLGHFGEPFADPSALPLYHLARLTRQHVTVALNGDGGDEAFGGYPRYWLDPWANRYLKLPNSLTRRLIPALMRPLSDTAYRPVGGSLVNGLKRLEQLANTDPRASLLRWGSFFSARRRAALWRQPHREALDMHSSEALLVERFSAAPADACSCSMTWTGPVAIAPFPWRIKGNRICSSLAMCCSSSCLRPAKTETSSGSTSGALL